MYTSSLSQPDSLKQNDEDDLYGGSFSLSQPNLSYSSPLTSPNQSPALSPFQSMILPTTTNTLVMTKTFGKDRNLSPVRENGNNFLTSKISPMIDSKKSNYYISPSETPKVLSPSLGYNKPEDPFTPSLNYYPMSMDNSGKKKNSVEKRIRKKSVVHALENIIEPNHQNDPVLGETKKSKFERKFNVFQLQNGKKCKVIYEGQFSRWIEEDPFSIYSDDVTRFSTTPSSTFEQRNDLSFERIVSQNNNGYWQKNNFLITRNEVVLFPNGKWDNRVVEVMSITDDINISISSILIAKLEWIIEVKTSESNVYTQSNFIYQAYKTVEKDISSNNVKTELTSDEANKPKDTKSEGKNTNKSNTTTTSSIASRQIKWILKFYDRESMLYFISLIKYIQTKKVKKLVNEEEEWGSFESDISSNFTSEDENSNPANEFSTFLTSETNGAKGLNATSPTPNFLSIPSNPNELGQSPPPRRERTSSLSERFYTTSIERRGSTKNTNPGIFSPVLETEDEYANTSLIKEGRRKCSEASANEVNALLKDSIHKAEIEIMKLQNWRNNRNQSMINSGANNNMEMAFAKNDGREQEKVVSSSFSPPKTNWQSSIDRNRRSRIASWNPNSNAAIFTNFQLSCLDKLENEAKNKIIKLNRNSAEKEKENLIKVKITDTEETKAIPATEESINKTENLKKKTYTPPRLQRSCSLKKDKDLLSRNNSLKDKDLIAEQRNSLSPRSKSHPIAIPLSSPSSKYNSISTVETGTSDGSSGNILRKGSVTGMSNNSSGFYSPRSSSLFIDDINILQKGSVGSQKRISGIINPEKKTNSILTNLTSTSTSSEALLTDQKSAFAYGVSSSEGEGQLNRTSIYSNVSRNSLGSSEHTGHNTAKTTPEIGQVAAMLRRSSLEGTDICIPPLNDGDNPAQFVGIKNINSSKVHPMHTPNLHNLSLANNNTELFTPNVASPNVNPNTPVVEGRPRSGSKTIISSLYRSNSYQKNFGKATTNTTATTTNNNVELDTNEALLMKLASSHVKPSSIVPIDNVESNDNMKRISSGSQGNVINPDVNYLPYMMDLKSSNELYLSSLQQHFQQHQPQQIQPTVMPNSPLMTIHSQPQSPLIPQIQPHFTNNTLTETIYKPEGTYNNLNQHISFDPNNTNYYSSKPLFLNYYDAEGQLISYELNDESVIPTSFLKNYPKKKSNTMDPIILNSLQALNILEQKYL
jgi:hypothetical protein